MDTKTHKCDECEAAIKRHIFCSRLCNQRYFNKQRYHSDDEVLNVAKEEEKTPNTSFEVCPKHKIFKNSCGCK